MVSLDQEKQPFLEITHTLPLMANVRVAKWDRVFSYERPDDDFKFSNSIFNYALSVAHAANGNLLEANRFQSMILNDIESERWLNELQYERWLNKHESERWLNEH